jgi:enolase
MVKIQKICAREILDSRGNPTVEVQLTLERGISARASVPSGASTGTYEALELRDGDKSRYLGKGVLNAVKNVNQVIAKEIVGKSFNDIKGCDNFLKSLDGTPNKSKLGANAILGVSIAFAKALALFENKEFYEFLGKGEGKILPVPFMNVINGGAHADNNLDCQEFMIIPGGFNSFKEALRAGAEIYHTLKSILKSKGHRTGIGDEGGFAPDLQTMDATVELLVVAIEKAGYKPAGQVALGLDVAASELYENGVYVFKKSDKSKHTTQDMISIYEKLISRYPIVFIEDGLAEDDWNGWKEFTARLGKKIQIIGDDIFVTNQERLGRGIEEKTANSVLIKPNQIGTITETIDVVLMAQHAKFGTIISHRSGETEDTTIANLAVALNTGMIKSGAPCRIDRLAKYNELLRIEESLGKKGKFARFDYLAKSK